MNIIGHVYTRAFLRKIASAGSLPHHAYLFSGPESVGKSAVATEFAALLLGVDWETVEGRQDFRRIVPEFGKSGRTRKIPIEAVRDAHVFLSRFPAEGGRRVLLIESADIMSDGAKNAILKMLEEPNDTSVLILVSSRPGALPETVRSRAFSVPFSLVPKGEIEEGIREGFGGEALASLKPIFLTLGRPGIVVSALADPEGFETLLKPLRELYGAKRLSFAERTALSERLSDSVPDTLRFFGWLVPLLLDSGKNETDPARISETYRLLEAIEETAWTLRETNANPRLSIDRLLLVDF